LILNGIIQRTTNKDSINVLNININKEEDININITKEEDININITKEDYLLF
jgi:hypothetical protein